jgi:hypothetical protein
MAVLPNQGGLVVPINWQGTTAKTTMQNGSFEMSGTIGWRPWSESATLLWIVTPSEAAAIMDTFEATNWNGVFDYDNNVRGPIRVRLTGDYSYQEKTDAGTQLKYGELSVGVKRT